MLFFVLYTSQGENEAIGMNAQAARVKRLQALVDEYGSQEKLGEQLGVTPGYISQLVIGHRPITEKTARKYERLCNKPQGWLDNKPIDAGDELTALLQVLLEATPEKRQMAIRVMRTLLDDKEDG